MNNLFDNCRKAAWPLGALAVYWLILCYQLGAQWAAYEQYNYGWAVPFLCGYLFWRRLKEPETENQLSPAEVRLMAGGPRVFGLIAVFTLAWAVLRWLHEANPIWRLTSWGLALVVVALTLQMLRLTLGAGRWNRFVFPVCYFLVAVPWPTDLELLVTQSLMRLNAVLTSELLSVAGIAALPQGNVIEIANGFVGVDEACSGIRSLQATLMISLFLGEFYRFSVRRRMILCLAGFALAFVFNIARTFLLVFVASTQGIQAISKWHDLAGVVILVGCFMGLWAISAWLGRGVQSASPDRPRLANFPIQARSLGAIRLLAVALILWFVVTEFVVEAWYRLHEFRAYPAQAWTVHWPAQSPQYQQVELSERVKTWMAFDEGGQCAWTESDGTRWQMFYSRWLPSRSLYARVRSQLNKSHRPEHCLVGAGMKQVADLGVGTYQSGETRFSLKRMVFERDGQQLRVFFAQYEDSANPDRPASYRENTAQRVSAALAGNRNYGLRMLEIAIAGCADQAEAERAMHRAFGKLIKPEMPATGQLSVRP